MYISTIDQRNIVMVERQMNRIERRVSSTSVECDNAEQYNNKKLKHGIYPSSIVLGITYAMWHLVGRSMLSFEPESSICDSASDASSCAVCPTQAVCVLRMFSYVQAHLCATPYC